MSFLSRSSFSAVFIIQKLQRPQITINRHVKRWVAPTLMELRKRRDKLGPQEPQPRSTFIEWNYRSELFAFGKRLGENFNLDLLQKAFTTPSYILKEEKRQQELGVENVELNMSDHTSLIDSGRKIVEDYLQRYLRISFPQLPADGLKAFLSYLTSERVLSHVGLHLGMKDLIYTVEYPPSDETLAKSLLAVIGALKESSGKTTAFLFVRDFIATQLNQKDLTEIWEIEEPENRLKEICAKNQLVEPEPRLIGDCGKNTVLAAYHVGIYSSEKLIGKGFGEDITTATRSASIDALRTFFGIQDNIQPLNFQLDIEKTDSKNMAIRE